MSDQQGTSKRLNVMDDEIDLQRLWALLVDHVWLILGTTVLALLLGLAYTYIATPIYKADALLQVEKKQAGLPGFEELSEMFSEESSSDAEIQIIRSRLVLGQVVDQFNMTVTMAPRRLPVIGRFGAPEPAPEFSPDRYSRVIATAKPS
ncbi:Putative tyrosine-protein kinase in cps region [Alcanivorax sp. ALC70]|nr:Putative tyrosine-protein kinase in cps region [Alcanivorax sp. ALC70]